MIQITSLHDDANSRRVRQLAALGQLWIFIDYFHPDTERRINWQSALIEALPKISDATSDEDYAAVVSAMLSQLNDPATKLWLVNRETVNIDSLPDGPPAAELGTDGMLKIRLNNGSSFKRNKEEAIRALDNMAEKVVNAKKVVIDLRSRGVDFDSNFLSEVFDESKLARVLSDKVVTAPRQTVRYYYGLKPATGTTSGSYTKFPKPYVGATFHPLKNSSAKRVVFLVNEFSHLPSLAAALQFADTGYIIADGPIRGHLGNRSTTITIPALGFVDVRISELGEYQAALGSFKVNETVKPIEGSDVAMARAFVAVNEDKSCTDHYKGSADGQFKRSTAKRSFPDTTQRILAAIRIWFVFSFFFPYKDLMEEDWDQILLDYIPKFEKCADATEYALTVMRMVSHVHDSHVNVFSDELDKVFGQRLPPFRCRMIEGKPVVTVIGETALAAGLRVGDVLVSVDGEDVFERMNRFRQYVSASTPQSEHLQLLSLILKGAAGSLLSLVVLEDRREKTIAVQRSNAAERTPPERDGEVVMVLPGNIGYVDLDRLPREDVKNMLEKLRHTSGIIFDVRGYPHGTAWDIAPRLIPAAKAGKITKRAGFSLSSIAAALFKCPLNPAEPGEPYPSWRTFTQTIPWSDDWKYSGKTVMLMDERTVSQAEHTGLFLKAANGTTFIGTPTTGANGDVTDFSLPGGIKVGLTGQSVAHPDGTQLQRVGLTPDIHVTATIKGVRDGVDEVLERALEFMTLFQVEKATAYTP